MDIESECKHLTRQNDSYLESSTICGVESEASNRAVWGLNLTDSFVCNALN